MNRRRQWMTEKCRLPKALLQLHASFSQEQFLLQSICCSLGSTFLFFFFFTFKLMKYAHMKEIFRPFYLISLQSCSRTDFYPEIYPINQQ